MKQEWYDNDWFYAIMFAATLVATVAANYYYHGGHIVW